VLFFLRPCSTDSPSWLRPLRRATLALRIIFLPATVIHFQDPQYPLDFSFGEIYRPSHRRLSVKIVLTFADRGCRVVSTTDPHGRILGFLDRSRNFSIQVAPQLSSRCWVDTVRDSLLVRKSGSFRNWTRGFWICTQEHWLLDQTGSFCSARSYFLSHLAEIVVCPGHHLLHVFSITSQPTGVLTSVAYSFSKNGEIIARCTLKSNNFVWIIY
jgi:hypothetical protein